MPQLDIHSFLPQLVWLAITFTALYLVMWRIAVPRIADVLEARQKRIDDNLDKAAESQKAAEAALEAYEESLAEARAEAQGHINEVMAKASAEAAERDAAQAEETNQILAEGEAAIDKAVADAMENVRAVALETAVAAVERLTGEAPDEKDVAEALDRALGT